MKRYKHLFILLGIACLGLSCQVGRMIFYNFADIKDYKKFPSRPLQASSAPFKFHTASGESGMPRKITYGQQAEQPFDDFLRKNKTVAFLVIRHDSILYEKYFRGYDESSIVPSFSMAKSFCSALIGCAIADKLIGSVNDPVTRYVPELAKNGFDKVSIKHLLQMTSGMHYNESYINPFAHSASFYYGRNLRRLLMKMKLDAAPGSRFEYSSGSTQLLGLVLERALGNKSVTDYLQEKIWGPLNMEYPASWSIDKKKNGLEKTFCCLNARARDYARFGRLYLHKGEWNGKQVIPASWVNESTQADTTDAGKQFYKYQWWLMGSKGEFYANGILGQFIYVNPAKDLIIVRLGKNYGKVYWAQLFSALAGKL